MVRNQDSQILHTLTWKSENIIFKEGAHTC